MRAYDRAAQMLGLRQRSYQSVFGEGGPAHSVLVDLAEYCGACNPDPDGIDRDKLMTMHGRRQAYFRIVNHLKLSPDEFEDVYRSVVLARARSMAPPQTEGDQ